MYAFLRKSISICYIYLIMITYIGSESGACGYAHNLQYISID